MPVRNARAARTIGLAMDAKRPQELYAFGPYRLDVPDRLLTRDGEPVALRAKVFDTLVVLVRRAGKLVTRDELIAAVWPDTIVEEGNLSHNVSALRKAFGGDPDERYVETVPRNGYRFVHALATECAATPEAAAGAAAPALDARDRARRFLAQGAWREAFEAFQQLREAGALTAADREGLAESARWSGRFDELVPLLEEAAEAWLSEGDPIRAADVSLDLAAVLLDRRRVALASSYARQAERRLPPTPPASGPALRAHARLARMRARLCWCAGDWEGALAHARTAQQLAHAAGDPDAEALAVMDVSHSLLALGRFSEAQGPLDETGALVTTGRLGPYASGMTLCGLIIGWQALGRPERAQEWSVASNRFADTTGVAYFHALCRVHRGELRSLRGELAGAEEDFVRGGEELTRAGSGLAGIALRELGTLRMRRGDLEGADEAFARALQIGTDPQPGYALLRAARGDALAARRDLAHFLSSEGNGETNLLDRENLLGVLGAFVRLALETGAAEEARAAVARIEAIAAATGSTAHRAIADAARGDVALAGGATGEALARWRASWRAWSELEAPFEAAAVRIRVGDALLAAGDPVRAKLEYQGAAATFEQLGALGELRPIQRRLAELEQGQPVAVATKFLVRGAIARAAELEALVGAAAWRELVAWLDRKLERCFADHGGRLVERGAARFAAEFDALATAEACVRALRAALQEQRTSHGFAPELELDAGPALSVRSGTTRR